MNDAKRKEIMKLVLAGKLTKEALNPPVFEIKHTKDGLFDYQINGISVDNNHFSRERDRLLVSPFDVVFKLPFRDD